MDYSGRQVYPITILATQPGADLFAHFLAWNKPYSTTSFLRTFFRYFKLVRFDFWYNQVEAHIAHVSPVGFSG